MLVIEAVHAFLLAVRGEIASNTQQLYRYSLSHLEPLDPVPITEVTDTHLRVLRGRLLDTYAPGTLNTFVQVWKLLFNWLVLEGFMPTSPAVRMRSLKVPPRLRAACLPDVIRMIHEAHHRRHFRDEAIMLLLLSTGIRVGAVCKMRLTDIDHADRRVTVMEKGSRVHTVNLIEPSYAAIDHYLRYERPSTDNPTLFASYRTPENSLQPNSVLLMLRRYADDLGITTPVNPHAFRHLFATEMLRNGASLDVVSKLLGHSSVTVTERHYAQWHPDTLREAHARYNPVINMSPRKG